MDRLQTVQTEKITKGKKNLHFLSLGPFFFFNFPMVKAKTSKTVLIKKKSGELFYKGGPQGKHSESAQALQ